MSEIIKFLISIFEKKEVIKIKKVDSKKSNDASSAANEALSRIFSNR